MWLSRFLFSSYLLFLAHAVENVRVTIPQGTLKGLKTTTVYKNHPYYSFKGVPYSKPMIEENKFNPPQPPEPWEGEWDATRHRGECVQVDIFLKVIKGVDDCLYLNVYTPDINSADCKPVMVWIHGGAFIFGSGNTFVYGPDFLIEKNVVVVTINYRLGPIGFLSTGDANIPGNVGMKDQVQAIRWVRENIQYFGGCTNKVTIFGESAGSASVQYHLLSPMSRGYFDGAIQQSGSATDEWAFNYNPREAAFALGESLGISTTDSKELLDHLKKMKSRDIVDASSKQFRETGFSLEAVLTWVPCVEPEVSGVETFLPDNPMNLIREGKIYDVPMIAGVNLDECALFMPDVMKYIERNKTGILDEVHTLIPNNMNITDVDEKRDIAKQIMQFYFGDKEIGHEVADELMALLTDAAFFVQYHITTLVTGEHIKSPIYKYLLTYRTPIGILKNFRPLGNVSSHADDLEYIWFSNFFQNKPKPQSPAERFVHIFTTMWTNFAKYGNPTPQLDDIIDVTWKPMGRENNILKIDMQLEMQQGFFPERMNFWINLYQRVVGEFGELLTYYHNAATVLKLSFTLISVCITVSYFKNLI